MWGSPKYDMYYILKCSVTVNKKNENEQYPGFARAHAPYYWLDSTQLNFRDRTRPGAVYVIWPFILMTHKHYNTYTDTYHNKRQKLKLNLYSINIQGYTIQTLLFLFRFLYRCLSYYSPFFFFSYTILLL